MLWRAAVLCFAGALGGCVLSDVDLSGKACPCAAPYVCETNRCVLTGFSADAAPRDGSPGDAETGADGPTGARDAVPDAGDVSSGDGSLLDGLVAEAGGMDAVASDALSSDAVLVDGGFADAAPDGGGGADASDSGLPDALPADAGTLLALGQNCTAGTQCASQYCLLVQSSTATAMQEFCSTPCGQTSDCPVHMTCRALDGMGFCLRENVFLPPGNFLIPSGGACMQANDPCQSTVCNTAVNQCVETCTREADCASFGGNCWQWAQGGNLNICLNPGVGSGAGAACSSNSGCLSGICNRNSSRCALHCCANADCPGQEVCDVYAFSTSVPIKVCRSRSPLAGPGRIGDTCQQNSDCLTEVCATVSSAGGGAKQCSTFCCKESDCAVLPQGTGICRPAAGPLAGTVVGTCFSN